MSDLLPFRNDYPRGIVNGDHVEQGNLKELPGAASDDFYIK